MKVWESALHVAGHGRLQASIPILSTELASEPEAPWESSSQVQQNIAELRFC